MARSRGGASIADVAHAANVSIATVSRVLNNPKLVSRETCARVEGAIAELGYVPNAFAQGLIRKTSRVLGVALPDLHGEFYSELLRGSDDEARRRGYHLLVSSEARRAAPANAPGSTNGLPSSYIGLGLIDGLVLMLTEPNEPLWKDVRRVRLPVVVIDAEIDDAGVDTVQVDNAVGAREAANHLLEAVPARQMCFVGGPKANFDTRRRAEEFVRVLREAGAPKRDDEVSLGEYSVQWGHDWAIARARAGKLKGTGVLAANDEIAMGVLLAAQEVGLVVPRDLRIVGFDGTRIASLLRPALSTVRVPLTEVGAEAVRMLIDRIESPDAKPQRAVLPTRLIIRESSGGPRAG